MKKQQHLSLTILITFTIIGFVFIACERSLYDLDRASYPDDPEVFIDGFSSGLNYAAFGGSKPTAFDVDKDVKFSGTASMRFEVPDFEDPAGAYAGGSYYTNVGRDLSGYDALTFWAKASRSATLDIIGFGNDLALSPYQVSRIGVRLNTNWQKIIIPIPDPDKLTMEKGMFFYSEGPENGLGYTFWIDELKFEKLGTIAHPRPGIFEGEDVAVTIPAGETYQITGTGVIFNLPNGVDDTVSATFAYYDFKSSDESVATVSSNGLVTTVAEGTAVITATMGDLDVFGSLILTVGEALPAPATAAPTPTRDAADVISLYSDAYTNVTVDAWATYWQFSTTEYEEVQINGNNTHLYTKLNFNGIEFVSSTIDASDMTHFHMDIWTPDPTDGGKQFKILLVDFGSDNAFGGGDDTSHEISLSTTTTPAIATETWVQLDIPLTAFTGLTNRANLAQLVISGDPNTVYVDNVYFYDDGNGGGGGGGNNDTEPTTAASAPTFNASDVVSLFSNTYSNVTIDTWSAEWDNADVADFAIGDNDMKKYTNLSFAGIEATTTTINASTMTHFYLNVWTPDATTGTAAFKIKLVDFGSDGAYQGGDDVEHEITLNSTSTPALTSGQWVTLNIPLTAFTGLTTKGHIAQIIISGEINTVFVDNLLFHK